MFDSINQNINKKIVEYFVAITEKYKNQIKLNKAILKKQLINVLKSQFNDKLLRINLINSIEIKQKKKFKNILKMLELDNAIQENEKHYLTEYKNKSKSKSKPDLYFSGKKDDSRTPSDYLTGEEEISIKLEEIR